MSVKQKSKKDGPESSLEFDFEVAMLELETLVSGMESGDLPLEESLKEFEKGIKLSRRCQQALNEAEQRVSILLDDQEENFQASAE